MSDTLLAACKDLCEQVEYLRSHLTPRKQRFTKVTTDQSLQRGRIAIAYRENKQ